MNTKTRLVFPFETHLVAHNALTGKDTPYIVQAGETLEVETLQRGAGEDGSELWDAYAGNFICFFGMPANFSLLE